MMTAEESAPTDLERVATAEPTKLRRNRDFMLLWSGTAVSSLGAQVSSFAYPLIVLWSGGSVVSAGVVGGLTSLPRLLLSLFAGVLIDRVDRRKLMMRCNLGRAISIGTLVLSMLGGHVLLPLLLGVAFIESSLSVLYQLAEHAAVRSVVDEEHLDRAISQNEARVQATGLLGQPLAGVLSVITVWSPLLFAAVSHVLCFSALTGIRTKFQASRDPDQVRRNVIAEIGEGIRWLWNHHQLRAAAGLVAVSNMLFEVLVLGILSVLRANGDSQAIVGLIIGAAGIGGMVGALSASWWTARVRLPVIVIGANVVWAALFPLTVLLKDVNPLYLGLISTPMACVGSAWTIAVVSFQIRVTPDEMQGRIASVISIVAFGTLPVGSFVGGIVLQAFGFNTSLLGCSLIMLALALAAMASPSLRRIGTSAEPTSASPVPPPHSSQARDENSYA